jgi:hypothetical protein
MTEFSVYEGGKNKFWHSSGNYKCSMVDITTPVHAIAKRSRMENALQNIILNFGIHQTA